MVVGGLCKVLTTKGLRQVLGNGLTPDRQQIARLQGPLFEERIGILELNHGGFVSVRDGVKSFALLHAVLQSASAAR